MNETLKTFSPRQVAQALGASEASIKRWCDDGKISCLRSAGGHRRIRLDQVIDFARAGNRQLERPELLGLPANTGDGPLRVRLALEDSIESLRTGDVDRFRSHVIHLYLSGESVSRVCDLVIAPAYNALGDLWACGELSIYAERRAGQVCEAALRALLRLLPPVTPTSPRAVGGAADSYSIPTMMVELVLSELGWKATSLGSSIPLSELAQALEQESPDLFWMSASHIEDLDSFAQEFRSLSDHAERNGVPFVVGGRALNSEIRPRLRYTSHCDTLEHLVAFVQSTFGDSGRTTSRSPERTVDNSQPTEQEGSAQAERRTR